MPKNDNAHAVLLGSSITEHCGETDGAEIGELFPLSKSANIDKKFEWAKNICDYLERKYDKEQVMQIRMDCACGPEMGKIKKLKELYEKSENEEDFTKRAVKLNQGFTIEYESGNFILIYPQCYCSCVKRVEQLLPETWCYCTLGYTKRMFETVLSCKVEVELLSSVKTGGEVCKIRIHRVS